MTTPAPAPAEPEAIADPKRVLTERDHATGIDALTLTVTGLRTVTPRLLRITAEPTAPLTDPAWQLPNVAIRLQISAGDAGTVSRVYTVRSFDAATGRMEIDVVLHPGASPMMAWAAALAVGDPVRLTGPRPHFLPPVQPGRRIALFLDETAIPALCAILAQWPAGAVAEGWVECVDAELLAELPAVPGVTLRHLPRDPEQPAGTSGALVAAAHALAEPGAHTVWAAGERDEMRAIRSHFRAQPGIDKAEVAVYGYWKHGMSTSEIDRHRLRHYEETLAAGGGIDDLDDLAIGV